MDPNLFQNNPGFSCTQSRKAVFSHELCEQQKTSRDERYGTISARCLGQCQKK